MLNDCAVDSIFVGWSSARWRGLGNERTEDGVLPHVSLSTSQNYVVSLGGTNNDGGVPLFRLAVFVEF